MIFSQSNSTMTGTGARLRDPELSGTLIIVPLRQCSIKTVVKSGFNNQQITTKNINNGGLNL